MGCGEGVSPLCRENVEFSSTNAGFYAFLLHKNNLWPETGTGVANQPPGAEDVPGG